MKTHEQKRLEELEKEVKDLKQTVAILVVGNNQLLANAMNLGNAVVELQKNKVVIQRN